MAFRRPFLFFISTHSLTRRLTRLPAAPMGEWSRFQLTASQGGWRIYDNEIDIQNHFNSQPHKEADVVVLLDFCDSFRISTHSLTRRLTCLWISCKHSERISTHSLTRRLTFTNSSIWHLSVISTHSLTRRLTSRETGHCFNPSISTHSLTRRLTTQKRLKNPAMVFQLTASQGGWQEVVVISVTDIGFQLTASQGGWLGDSAMTAD